MSDLLDRVPEPDRSELIELLKRRNEGTDKQAGKLNRKGAKYHLRYCPWVKALLHEEQFYKTSDGGWNGSIPGRKIWEEGYDGPLESEETGRTNGIGDIGREAVVNDFELLKINTIATNDHLTAAYKLMKQLKRAKLEHYLAEVRDMVGEADPLGYLLFRTHREYGSKKSRVIRFLNYRGYDKYIPLVSCDERIMTWEEVKVLINTIKKAEGITYYKV